MNVLCSVPQVSVLGLLLSAHYKADQAGLAVEYDIMLHAFTNDTQLYLYCESGSLAQSVTALEQCVTPIRNWMSANHL